MVRSTTATKAITVVSTAKFAGIDYHKKFIVVTLGDADGKILEQRKLVNDAPALRSYFSQFPGLVCAVESCRGYEWFLDLLKDCGLEAHLCNPYRTKLIVQSRCKTDKIDSKNIMELLAKGYLPTCYQPTPEERRLRERLRYRTQLMRQATRAKLQIHVLLDKENKGQFCKDIFSAKGRQLLQDVDLSPERKQLLQKHLEVLNFFESRLCTEKKWIDEEVRQSRSAQNLMTIPGIGELSALLFIAEVGDVTRFRNAPQVPAYIGLVPSESSSAERRRVGPITKQGSGLLRWMLIQNAWMAIAKSIELRRRFASISKRRGKNTAIVAIARVLAEVAYRVLRDGCQFDESKLAAR
jgi:transposase